MIATYIRKQQGKSNNAYYAEQHGRYPLTVAVKIISLAIRPYYKITQKTIRYWLESIIQPCEYHHVGKYANVCNYYDTNEVLDVLLNNNYEDDCIFWDNLNYHFGA